MDIHTTEQENVTIVFIDGEVDASTSEALLDAFKALLLQGKNFLVADLAKTGYMSSAGLRVLLATMKEARAKGGDLRLSAVQGNVERMLKLSGFTKFIKSYPNIEATVNSYRS